MCTLDQDSNVCVLILRSMLIEFVRYNSESLFTYRCLSISGDGSRGRKGQPKVQEHPAHGKPSQPSRMNYRRTHSLTHSLTSTPQSSEIRQRVFCLCIPFKTSPGQGLRRAGLWAIISHRNPRIALSGILGVTDLGRFRRKEERSKFEEFGYL